MVSLYCDSASLGFNFVNFFASTIRAESTGAILMGMKNDCGCNAEVVWIELQGGSSNAAGTLV